MFKGMGNMANAMKQAQQMQQNMKALQDRLETLEMEGQSGGGLVKVQMTGKNMVRRVTINPSVVVADDVETLEDLVAAAMNDAQTKVQDYINGEVNKITGGMSLPGLM